MAGPWEREKSLDILRMEAICCPVHGGGNCQSLAGVAGWLMFFLGIQVCWRTGGDMHLTSGAVQCGVLGSLVYEWRSRRALGDSSPADET